MNKLNEGLEYFSLGWAYSDVGESIENKKSYPWKNIDTIIENLGNYHNFVSKALDGENYSGSAIASVPLMYKEAVSVVMGKDEFDTRKEVVEFRGRVSALASQLNDLKKNPDMFHKKSHEDLSGFLDKMGNRILSKATSSSLKL